MSDDPISYKRWLIQMSKLFSLNYYMITGFLILKKSFDKANHNEWPGNMYGNLIHLLNNHTKSEEQTD